MKDGDKYYTYPHDAMLPLACYTQEDLDEVTCKDIHREWVYGENPVFDELAFKRCKIYTSKDECIKDAWARIAHLLEVDK